jgi:thiol-disulfide isomerase/thioredoxin
MNTKTLARAAAALLAVLVLSFSSELAAQGRQAPPPEYKELVAASEIRDPAIRLREFERIKAAFPSTRFMEAIDASIMQAKVELSGSLEGVLALQEEFMAKAQGSSRLLNPSTMAVQLVNHPNLAAFDPKGVLAAVIDYRERAHKAAADEASFVGVPDEQREYLKTYALSAVELVAAKAQLNAGDVAKARASLDAYRKAGGATGGNYQYVVAAVAEKQGRNAEALDSFLAAAVEEYLDAADRAKALYAKIYGGADGFEAALAAKVKALPFHPEPFKAPAGWKGKAVLAELFTGSECPPCVGADLAFDGLLETFPSKYLAVLVYHLPIPRPDPMMNPASEVRQKAYAVNSTPTIVLDGTNKTTGGGARGAAEGKYAQFRAAIEPLLSAAPGIALKAQASLAGDTVKVSFDHDKAVAGAEYLLILAQDEQEHKGGNGVEYHRMVVRDLRVVDPAGPKTAAFDLAASEQAADAYLSEFEKTYTRVPGFKWEVRRNGISRRGLKVVYFVQEKASGQVLNAVVADVK